MAIIDVSNNLEDFRVKINVSDNSMTLIIDHYSGKAETVTVPAFLGKIPVTTIGSYSFLLEEKIKQITISEGIVSIEQSAITSCEKLVSIILPKSLTSIGDGAFNDCPMLTNIKLPENLVSIGYEAFENCESLTSIHLPKNLVKLGEGVFSGCNNLTEITVAKKNPAFKAVDGVLFTKNMNTLLFYPGGRKGDYIVPDSVFEIHPGAFHNCKELTRITLPEELISLKGEIFIGCEKLLNITVQGQNSFFSGIKGVLVNKEKKFLIRYPKGRRNKNYIVPDTVLTIGHGAFYECKFLKNIVLPENLVLIGDETFSGCEGLNTITFPNKLKFIGERAFENCPNLKTITLSKKTKLGCRALDGFSGKLIYKN